MAGCSNRHVDDEQLYGSDEAALVNRMLLRITVGGKKS
jgi:hypothetical protein